MSLILRTLARALELNLSPLFLRSFSVYHTVQVSGDYAKWCLENPEAYERKLVRQQAYQDRLRSTRPEVYRRRLDTAITRSRQQYQDPVKGAQMRERTRLRDVSLRGDERHKFYKRLLSWGLRYPWLREDLPWKSYQPVYHDDPVEHYCEGCDWTRKRGNRLFWKKIQSSPTEADSWLCHSCYIPKSDWKEAMPRGYEGLTTIKEIAKRRYELGHGTLQPHRSP
jgi:hypothetical protein